MTNENSGKQSYGKLSYGKYIIIDGISGSGKETQARLLGEWLTQRGYEVHRIFEPSDGRVKKSIKQLQTIGVDNTYIDAALFVLDRSYLVHREIVPSLKMGKIVLSVRGFTSTLAIESDEELTQEYLIAANSFVPVADAICILDLPAELAYSRVQGRDAGTWHGEKGKWEVNLEKMRTMREKYLQLKNLLQNVEIIDAGKEIGEVQMELRRKVVHKIE